MSSRPRRLPTLVAVRGDEVDGRLQLVDVDALGAQSNHDLTDKTYVLTVGRDVGTLDGDDVVATFMPTAVGAATDGLLGWRLSSSDFSLLVADDFGSIGVAKLHYELVETDTAASPNDVVTFGRGLFCVELRNAQPS